MSLKQDTARSRAKQVNQDDAFSCEASPNLQDFSQSALLKLGLNEYFRRHPQEDEVAAFAAYLIRHLRLPQNHRSVKAHIAKVIAGQTSMELDWWIMFGEFTGLLNNYLSARRASIKGGNK